MPGFHVSPHNSAYALLIPAALPADPIQQVQSDHHVLSSVLSPDVRAGASCAAGHMEECFGGTRSALITPARRIASAKLAQPR